MRYLTLVFLLLVAVSCVRPSSEEQFVRRSRAVDGVYSFRLDLSDTTVLYDLSLFTRRDERDASGFPFTASWYREDSLCLEERLFFPPDSVTVCYRRGVSMTEPGVWRLDLRPCCPPEGFCGMGLICKRNGTR